MGGAGRRRRGERVVTREKEHRGEKSKGGQEHCDREKTNHLERGGGRDQLCGVRDEERDKNRKQKQEKTENLEHRKGK